MAHDLSEAILWGLQQWRDPAQRNTAPPAGQFFLDQMAIGWERFLDGWLAKTVTPGRDLAGCPKLLF